MARNEFSTFFLLAFPFVCALAEGIFFSLFGRRTYNWKIFYLAVFISLIRFAWIRFEHLNFVQPISIWAYKSRLLSFEFPGILELVLVFLIGEFVFYWMHRALHEVRCFWPFHFIHHAPEDMNMAVVSLAPFFADLMFVGQLLLFLPAYLFGFKIGLLFLSFAVTRRMQFWIHVTWIPKLGWLEYVLNTPTLHQIHHSINPEYRSGN